MNEDKNLPYEAKPAREMADYIINQLRDGGSYPGAKSIAYVEHLYRAALAASGVAAPVAAAMREASSYASAFSAETPVVPMTDVWRILSTPSQPVAAEPHPPSRQCGCSECAPSFEPTPVAADAPAEVAAYHAWCGSIADEATLRRAVSVCEDVLTDIADWEDKELAKAVESVREDLAAMADVISADGAPALAAPVEVQGADSVLAKNLRRLAGIGKDCGRLVSKDGSAWADMHAAADALAGRPTPASEAEPVAPKTCHDLTPEQHEELTKQFSAADSLEAMGWSFDGDQWQRPAPAAEAWVTRKAAQLAINHASLGVPGSLAQATAMLDGDTRPAAPLSEVTPDASQLPKLPACWSQFKHEHGRQLWSEEQMRHIQADAYIAGVLSERAALRPTPSNERG